MTLAAAPALAQSAPATLTAPLTQARAQTEMEKKAVAYLLSRQDANGAWLAQVGPGVTALVTRGLIQSGKPADDPVIKKAMAYIESTRQSDGGYYVGGQPTYHTAIVLSLLARMPGDHYAAQIKQAQAFLEAGQAGATTGGKDDRGNAIDKNHSWYGGWGYGGGGGGGRPDMSNTHFVVEALRDSGVKASDPVMEWALTFLTHMQASEQNDQAWSSGLTDGGFIYAMGWNAKHNFYGQSSAPDTERDGKQILTTYGSMTYAGLKSMLYCDLKKDDPRVTSVLKWVKNNWTLEINPGVGNTQGLYYYYLTLASGLSAWGGDVIVDAKNVRHDWRTEYEAKMKAVQHPDGSYANDTADRWMEQVPELATAYVVLGLQHIRQADGTH
jgi:squalene-hopene/tetraprenyl-beta-curcumene cyclase